MTVGKWNAMLTEFGNTRSNFPGNQKETSSGSHHIFIKLIVCVSFALTSFFKVRNVPECDYPLAKESGRQQWDPNRVPQPREQVKFCNEMKISDFSIFV